MKFLYVVFAVAYLMLQGIDGKVFQELEEPSTQLSISTGLSHTKFHQNLSKGYQKDEKATLPDLSCETNDDCYKYDEPLICSIGQCDCIKPLCWVYHYESSGWTSSNVFTCDDCGQLGSWCNETYTCDEPGICWNDGFCHCPRGENFDGICVTVDQSWTLKVTLGGFGIIFLVAMIVIAYNCYRNRPWERPGWCWGVCNKMGSARGRRGSCEKSPAFTIQHLYASQISSINGEAFHISLENELHTSPGAQRNRFRLETTAEEPTSSSIASVETTSTNLESTLSDLNELNATKAAVEENPPGAFALPTTAQSLSAVHETSEPGLHNIQESIGAYKNSDTTNVSSESNCKHERCHLCLPKGLSVRPSSSSSQSGSTTRGSTPDDVISSAIEIIDQTKTAERKESEIKDIECTQF
ncbi:hypothetical protein SK128_015401 [Halocaridina rubra]|uniref:Uncharacterized protein n=1 Tax=Halocaridina rubra TaxID=373956 RepID=A0AAN9A9U0_HALRR